MRKMPMSSSKKEIEMIDNFDIIRSHLTFESNFDRYIIHIIKRAKDDKGVEYGSNETNRLIKTFYITSLEYFDKKVPVIKDLCDSNNARAYILPQVRNNEDCLKELLKIVVDNLSNPTQKPDHLIRSAYCGYHGSRDKKWILDLDNDNMTEYRHEIRYGGCSTWSKTWTPEEVLKLVQDQLVECKKTKEDAWMVPTRNGHCIVTSPFNLIKASEQCTMLFQGVSKKVVGKHKEPHPVDFQYSVSREKLDEKDINGWLIKDGMCLLYVGF